MINFLEKMSIKERKMFFFFCVDYASYLTNLKITFLGPSFSFLLSDKNQTFFFC